jgi:hypothetical protein
MKLQATHVPQDLDKPKNRNRGHTHTETTSQQKASDRPDIQMVCRFISEEGEEILELLRYVRKTDVALNFGDCRREEIWRAWIDRQQQRTHENNVKHT